MCVLEEGGVARKGARLTQCHSGKGPVRMPHFQKEATGKEKEK